MKKIISVFLITFALSACNLNKLQVYDLRCEYLTEPLGIDNPYASEQMTAWDYSPRVAWKCKRQKAKGLSRNCCSFGKRFENR